MSDLLQPQPLSIADQLSQMNEEQLDQARAGLRSHLAALSGSKSFDTFVKQAWQYVPACDTLAWAPHLDALCLHFEEVARGNILKLLVNIPPGHAKSVLLAVLWPAWIWTWWPRCQFLFGSYSAELATRDSLRCRAVIESEWYRKQYSEPAGWTLRGDQNAKHHFINTAGGERFSTGIGGTGRRAHIIGIDDPIDATERNSKATRDSANDWISQTISQRFVDSKTGRIAMIMQRLHEDDPAGFVLRGGGWEHLMLPSEFDPERRSVTHHTIAGVRSELWRDPRTEPGEVLFEQRFPRDILESFKLPNSLGAFGYSAQHDQNPTPSKGNMFQKDWWRFWKHDGASDSVSSRPMHCSDMPARVLPAFFDEVVMSIDANFKANPKADPVAIHVWARLGADRFWLYRINDPLGFAKSVEAIREVKRLYPDIRRVLIETKANGDAIIETLKSDIEGVIGVEPYGGKEARAWSAQPLVQAGNCYLPDGVPWLDAAIGEFAAFPRGKHDDDVDAWSQAMTAFSLIPPSTAENWLRSMD